MEFFSLHSPTSITCLPSSSSRKATMEKSTFIGQALTFPSINKRCPDVRNLRFLGFRTRASGPMKDETGSSRKMAEAIKQEMGTKDNDLVFVAGATGRVGSRTVRELLRLGFRVRAGVRSVQRAETLVESVPQMKLDDVTGSSSGIKPVEKLEIVECDLENRGGIGPAIDNASIVVCCIGASEKEVFDITGPYRIDYAATKNLIEAATVAKVDHFILLTSLGTNKIGFPAAILNLFWGVLIWKRKAEEALIASGLPYTIVRPGGMERPTDAYKETHNIVLANEDTYFGGQVSNLQVAELMACMAKNRKLSFCKVVEVIAETTAPLIPMEELLAKIPSQRIDSSSLEELQAEPKPDPAPLSIESKPSTVVEKESIQMEPPKTRPLSPYTVYDDLKPPTSPSPTPSTTPGSPKEKHVDIVQDEIEPQPKNAQNSSSRTAEDVTEKEPAHAPVQKTRPLSPYMAYEDLKPPTSPIPTPSSASIGLKERLVNATPALASNTGYDTAGSTQTASHQSPYHVDSAAAVSQSPIADESGDGQHFKQPKPRPLSPFTMYEDMKPPTSPLPSLPK